MGRMGSRRGFEAKSVADPDPELTREVPRDENPGAGTDRVEGARGVAGREGEVLGAIGRKRRLVEGVDADPHALVLVLGEADPLDSGHAGDGEEPPGQVLVDPRLDPTR